MVAGTKTKLVDELGKLQGTKADTPVVVKPSGETAAIEVEGKKVAEGPLINGYVFAPVRALAELLDAAAKWNGREKTVTVNKK